MPYQQYTVVEWMLFFYIYCFLGWCIESTFVSVNEKKFVNRGFMRGPFLPLYGSGAVIMLFVTIPVRDNLILTYIFGAIGATILEYVTGVVMEALFKVRYWDYSDQPFNLNGHICLGTTLAWGGLTILMTKVIHAPVEHLVMSLDPQFKGILVLVLTVVIAADFSLSFKAALDIRDLLSKMTVAREELNRIQSRLDAIIAFTSGEAKSIFSQQTENTKDRISAILQGIKSRLDFLQKTDRIQESAPIKSLTQFRDEIEQLKAKYFVEDEHRRTLSDRLGSFRKNMLKSHPTISSPKFSEALKELKEIAEEKHHKED